MQDSKKLNDREVLRRFHENDRLPTSSILKSRERQGDGYHRESRIRMKGDTDRSYHVRLEVHEGDKRLDDESDRYRRNSSKAHKSEVKRTSEEYIPVYSEPEYRNRKQVDASYVDYARNHFRHCSVRDELIYHLPISDNRRYPEMDDIGGKSNYSREYRSRFTDDENDRRNLKKKSKHDVIKLGYFDGTTASQPLEVFLVQLNSAAEFNDWTIKDCLAHLKASLRGSAAQLLWESPMHSFSYVELIDKLKQRFGSGNLTAQFKSQLKARRRGKSESLQMLYTDICGLLSLAYTNQFELPTTQEIGIDCFLEAIDDPQIERRVRDKDFASLDETFRHCLKLEACDRAISMRSENKRATLPIARAVQPEERNIEIKQMFSQLQKTLEKDTNEIKTRLSNLESDEVVLKQIPVT